MDQVFLSFSLDEQPITRAVNSSHCQELLEQFAPNILCLVNGRRFDKSYKLQQYDTVTLHPKLCGGKGGFGSMLRAIGAQIEATTNNDACRDLSGKRLRDVKCEKLMKDWSEKKAHEKDDRKERKKQKLQNILERPARIKAEDNTYISEMRSMSDSVEAAIATAIAEDDQVKHITLPAPSKSKKWFDEDSDSSEDEKAGSSSDQESSEDLNPAQTDTQSNEHAGENTGEVQSEKGEIKITFMDESEETKPVEESTTMEVSEIDQMSHVTSTEEPGTQSDNDSHPETAKEETECAQPSENCPIEENQEPIPDKKNWDEFEFADMMLADLGADKIKSILSDMGLKCGGTPFARAERLFSVRNLPKEEIPPSLFATSGKGKKRKVAQVVDR